MPRPRPRDVGRELPRPPPRPPSPLPRPLPGPRPRVVVRLVGRFLLRVLRGVWSEFGGAGGEDRGLGGRVWVRERSREEIGSSLGVDVAGAAELGVACDDTCSFLGRVCVDTWSLPGREAAASVLVGVGSGSGAEDSEESSVWGSRGGMGSEETTTFMGGVVGLGGIGAWGWSSR